MNTLCGILLAAGTGGRFGSNKLLHPLADGTTLLLNSARRLHEVMQEILVVVNADDDRVQQLLSAEGIEFVPNHDASRGMGSSLACGVMASATAKGWVIALADMPWIQPQTIRAIATSLDDETVIAAPCYRGQRGHPVGFGRRYAEELMRLQGDEGAKRIIASNQRHLTLFDTNDAGVIADIDTLHDLFAEPDTERHYSPGR